MEKSPWIPLTLGVIILALGPGLILLIPETLNHSNAKQNEAIPSQESPDKRSFFTALKDRVNDSFKHLAELASILKSLSVILLLITFILLPFSKRSVELSLRYVSKRFGWKLWQTGYLLSIRAFVNIILLIGVLPGVSWYLLKRRGWTSKGKDLILAELSGIMFVLGAIIIAASTSAGFSVFGMAVWTLGTGFTALTRSLITSLVDKEHVGSLYAAVAVVETTAALPAGPLLAALYAAGLRLKGAWIGLPFYGLAVIALIGTVAVFWFGFLKNVNDVRDESDDEETGLENSVGLEGANEA
jgi:hypothetical protein